MDSIMTSQGVAVATAMAVSGTVILLAFRLQKSFPATQLAIGPTAPSPEQNPRPCLSPDGKKRERKKKKKVQFAEDVVEPSGDREELRRRQSSNGGCLASNPSARLRKGGKVGEMPANRMALYNGMLRDRLVHRLANSY